MIMWASACVAAIFVMSIDIVLSPTGRQKIPQTPSTSMESHTKESGLLLPREWCSCCQACPVVSQPRCIVTTYTDQHICLFLLCGRELWQ